MKYFSKIFITLFILVFAFFGFCNVAFAENTVSTESAQTQQAGQISPTVKDSYGEENSILYLPNVLSILLIAIGIVLILLAIAIFTRLRR